jgi:transaldolase
MTNLQLLYDKFGQSPWLDNLSRQMLDDGTIQKLIGDGIRGLTSNPTIFEKALSGSAAYDAAIAASNLGRGRVVDLYWNLAVEDIQRTADLLRPVFDTSAGNDGFVSLEVSPEIAEDSDDTINQGRDLWQRVNRPNLMIKVPATKACLPSIRRLTADGLNVNITLIFGLERYREVIDAFLSGLEAREGSLGSIHSVASFFVSRVDTEVDGRLEKMGSDLSQQFAGKAGLAQARLAYQIFTETFSDANPRWAALKARGANLQRPLWASTSTKNPTYDPLLYVKGLIAPHTVNTLPNATIDTLEQTENSVSKLSITAETIAAARTHLEQLEQACDIRMSEVADLLEEQGIEKFHASFASLITALAAKMPA